MVALITIGVPWNKVFDDSFELHDLEMTAITIAAGESKGGIFDWGSWEWRKIT